MSTRPTALLALSLLGLSACTSVGSGPIPTPDLCAALAADQALELGTGGADFVALEDGDEVEQSWGPQGGDHVWASLRMQGVFGGGTWTPQTNCGDGGDCSDIAPGDAPRATIELWHGDELVAATAEDTPVRGVDGLAIGLTVFLFGPYSTAEMTLRAPESITDEEVALAEAADRGELQFVATLRDACGSELTAERNVSFSVGWLAGA
jgi:hypothetical protein